MLIKHALKYTSGLTPVLATLAHGQSHEVGSRNDSTGLPAAILATMPAAWLQMFDRATSGNFVSYQGTGLINEQPGPPEGPYPNTFGSDYGVGRQLSVANGGAVVYRQKHTKGGTVLGDNTTIASSWNKGLGAGSLYVAAQATQAAFIAKLASMGKVPNFLCWETDIGISDGGDVTRAANFTGRFPTFLTDVRADFLTPTTLMILCRPPLDPTGYAFQASVRADYATAYNADPVYRRIINCDGIELPVAPGPDHPTAAGQWMRGELIGTTARGIPHPYDNVTDPPIFDFYPGDIANDPALGATYASMRDGATGIAAGFSWASTGTAKPARNGTYGPTVQCEFDGIDDLLTQQGGGTIIGNPNGFSMNWAFSLASPGAAKDIYSEGSSSSGTPFFDLRLDALGTSLTMFHRDDANNVLNPTLVPAAANLFDGALHHLEVHLDRVAQTIQAVVDGAGQTIVTGFNPGVCTVNYSTFGALRYNSGALNLWSAMKVRRCIVLPPSSAAIKARMRTFMRTVHGTP